MSNDGRGLVGLLHRADWTRYRYESRSTVIDADLGLVLRPTSHIGTRPVHRLELRDIDADAGEFQVELPADLPTVEEPPF